MAILEFQKPEKVIVNELKPDRGLFEFRPLEPGYGITIGNSLRRILLSSLEGFAISGIKFLEPPVPHEFSTIKYITEDVTEIILNLKKVRLKRQVEGVNEEKVIVSCSEGGRFTAGDIGKALLNFKVLNPDLVIFTAEPGVKVKFELHITKGRGYVPSEENKPLTADAGFIPMDAIYTPIRNVRYSVENYRVEQKTDYERLLIEVETDGSINPKDALKEAAKILIHHLYLFADDEKLLIEQEEESSKDEEDVDEETLRMRQLLSTPLSELDLSARALNCLKAADVETLGDLVSYQKNDLLKFRNFGQKSLTELTELLKEKGLTFGMDVSKYFKKK
ncbi:MAG: DNA-directed RNA polymerase subunit alpha [Flavobacteriales bacterium]|nr:DNA-directed RNA polymerase subunit alpha [Flavobacteriales bacterium]MCX7768018.1 DNA-directed RNA polymerase subunit alpha [Flavobacteriales bacterium]MDW8409223.1 DNA-directed RNA polymerase subunit alpha [Flavobacteriales bacterium]